VTDKFVYDASVRWSDMDAYGHVNNARFLTLYEEARVAMFFVGARARGLTSFEDGIVISRHEIDYLRPVDYGEAVANAPWEIPILVLAGASLYEILHRKVQAGTLGGHDLPYLLCFRSERGRNYARVFQDLLAELDHDTGPRRREVALTIVTHAECHIPRPTVEVLARRASLYGVFVLPSQPLAVDYLPLLRHHQVVTAETLAQAAEKRRQALQIVREAVGGRS